MENVVLKLVFLISEKPIFRVPLRVEIFGEFGKEINIPCDVIGTPKPNVTWFRDGMPISEIPNLRYKVGSNETDLNSLKINYLKLDDSSLYQCKAENEAGDIVGYSWLRVKSK